MAARVQLWPMCCRELTMNLGGVNAGLTVALELLKDIADKYDGVSYADLFQLASATAIEARGPA